MKRRLTALLCALTLTLPFARAAEAETGYHDVPGDAWYVEAVQEMTDRGLMQGTGEGNFSPQAPVSRATVITVLWRLEGEPQVPAEVGNFPDVDPNDEACAWYAPAAAWAKSANVASGNENGTFHGGDPVTREQLAVFLCNYAKYKGQPVAEGAMGLFQDATSISDWAWDSVQHAVGLGLLQGDELGRLKPQGLADRATLATILQRMLTPAAG